MSRLEPLLPAYDFSSAPVAVSLCQGSAELHFAGENHVGTGDVQFRFLPRPRVVINARFPAGPFSGFGLLFNERADEYFSFNGQKIEGFHARCNANDNGLEVDWASNVEPMLFGDTTTTNTVAVVSHLFNFPDFRKGGHPDAAPIGCSLLILESGEWRILLQSLPGNATHQAWERINREGGSFLTHLMKLDRRDGSAFSEEDAAKQNVLISNFLSFLKGGRCWAVCEVGLDTSGVVTWRSFASPRISNPPYSWFDRFSGNQAESLFPLFAGRWQQSDEWRDCLQHAIYWYTQANTSGGHPGIDSALILAQTALERLAHHYAVVDRRLISAEGFKALKASDKLRMLFASLRIPTDIGPVTPGIQRLAGQFNWVDAPHAITHIRNSLVHPDNRKPVRDCYVEAWALSLWYLELSILALCSYDGTYRNRLIARYAGQVEHVPWASTGGRA